MSAVYATNNSWKTCFRIKSKNINITIKKRRQERKIIFTFFELGQVRIYLMET